MSLTRTQNNSEYTLHMLEKFRSMVAEYAGLILSDTQDQNLLTLIRERCSQNRRMPVDQYLNMLSLDTPAAQTEWGILFRNLTIGESYFFRDEDQLRLIESQLLPAYIRKNPDRRHIKIWSAGCATGEEPYSLSMMLSNDCFSHGKRTLEILGTDINEAYIQTAEKGVYGSWSFRNIDPCLKKQYFTRHHDKWRICDAIREKVAFKQINLVRDTLPRPEAGIENMDIILCRNVFIYFNMDTIARLMEKFASVLRPGGYLLTGHAEVSKYPKHLLKGVPYPQSIVYERCDSAVDFEPETGVQPATGFQPEAIPFPETQIPVFKRVTQSCPPAYTRSSSPPDNPPERDIDPMPELQELFFKGDYESLAQRVHALAGVPAPAYILLARAAANNGNLPKAKELCRKALESNDMNPSPYYLLATIALAQDQARDARRNFNKAIYIDPAYAPAHLGLADLLMLEDDPAKAYTLWAISINLIARLPEMTPVEYFEEYPKSTLIDLLKQQLKTGQDEQKDSAN